MRKLVVVMLALSVALGAGVAFGATTDVTYEKTYTIGEDDIYSIGEAIADAMEHYDDEDDEDPDTFKVIKIILTDNITEEDLADIPFEDPESDFTRITLQGKTSSITITPSDILRHFTMNNAKFTLGLENLTIAGNDEGGGGIILQEGTIDARGVIFTGNNSTAFDEEEDDEGNTIYPSGGAFYITGGTAIFTGCTFTSNVSSNGGAICAEGGDLTFSGSSFTGNTAEYGGAMYISNNAKVTFSDAPKFTGNTASVSGGAIYTLNALTLDGATFTANSAGSYGGAIHFENASGSAITNAKFGNGTTQGQNSAPYGGAVSINSGLLTLSTTDFTLNSADIGGGAVYSMGTLSFGDGLTFSSNKALNGGAMCISGDGTISANSSTITFSRNSATNGGAVYSTSGSSINSLTYADFLNNSATYGGAIYIAGESSQSTFVLDSTKDYTFSGNYASSEGGAVYTLNADVLVEGLTIDGSSNSAGEGGGFLRSGGSAIIRNATISGQYARFGGAVYSVGDATITNSEFIGNTAETNTGDYNGGGGAIYVLGSLKVSSSDFSDNQSISPIEGHGGGAIFVSGDAEIDSSKFTGNIHQNSGTVANGGGAIRVNNGTLTVTAGIFTSNQAAGSTASQGGAIFTQAAKTSITDCLFRSNKAAGNGGALIFTGESDTTIEHSVMSDNSTSGSFGGSVYAQGNFTVTYSYFNLNRAYGNGGAIYFNQQGKTGYGAFKSEVNMFTQNSAGISPSQYGSGGALYLEPETASINRCTFDTNISSTSNGTSAGGGVYLDVSNGVSGTVTTVKNSTFFGNQVSGGSTNYGGGLYTKGDCQITSCTFTGNQAVGSSTRAGALYADTGTVTVTATILVGNIAEIGRDVYADGTITSRGYNRIGVYGKGGSNTSWIADVIGSGTDRENSSWSTVTFFGDDAALTETDGTYTAPQIGITVESIYEENIYLLALPLNEIATLAEADRATNMIPYARRYTLNIEQYDEWGTDRFASGNNITIGALHFGSGGSGGGDTSEGSFDIASITMSGIPNTLKYPGQTASLIAMIRYTNGRVAYGVPSTATSIVQNQQERVVWSSSNANAVKIDQNGNITALRATSGTNGVTISVETVRYTLAGSPAKTSQNVIVTDNNGYEYMNISPEYYTYFTQNFLPNVFEYDISAAIADMNPQTVKSSTFRTNFGKVWSSVTPSQITDLTTSTPTFSVSTSSPAPSGMAASKRAGVSMNYQNRATGELFPITYSWTFTGAEISSVMGYDLTSRNINATLAGSIFEKFRIAYQGNNQLIPVIGGSGISGNEAYEAGVLSLTKADGNAGLRVELTAYVGNLAVTGNSDGAQVIRSAGTARALVVPDGAADGAIVGSMWMFQPSGTKGDTTPGTNPNPGTTSTPDTKTSGGGGGGGGCNAVGYGLVAAIVLFLKRRHS